MTAVATVILDSILRSTDTEKFRVFEMSVHAIITPNELSFNSYVRHYTAL